MEEYRESAHKRGRIRTGSFSMDDCNGLDGDEIFFDENRDVSLMSSFYLARWKQKNKNSQLIMNNGIAHTSVKIGGRTYSAFFLITGDFSPLILGKDFFQANKWSVNKENNIETPYCKIQTVEEEQIDTELTERVFTTNEVTASKGSNEDKIRKLLWPHGGRKSVESNKKLIKSRKL